MNFRQPADTQILQEKMKLQKKEGILIKKFRLIIP
jgi:hypothetical protein